MVIGLVAGCQRGEPAAGSAEVEAKARASSSPPAIDPFAVRVVAPASVAVGAPAELLLEVTARSDFHVNAEYPHNFRPAEGAPGVRFDAAKYDLGGSAEKTHCEGAPQDTCTLRARIPFQVTAQGDQRVEGVLAFSVCSDDLCLIEKAPITASTTGR